MLNKFEYEKPARVDELIALLGRYGNKARILAGGTDLLVQIEKRRISPRYLVDVTGVPEMEEIEEEDSGIRIGPAVTLGRLEKSPLIRKQYPALWKALQAIGSPQIRNMGTVGGNLCVETRCKYVDFSHPWGRESSTRCFKREGTLCHVMKGADHCHAVMSGDLATIMIVLNSSIVITGKAERSILLEDLYTGEGKGITCLKPCEAITRIRIPFQPAHSGISYFKHRWRESLDFPVVNAAASVLRNPIRGTVEEIRVVLGALASAPIRLRKTEDLLRRASPAGGALEEAVEEGMKGIPIVPCLEIPAGYVRKMASTFALKAIQEAYEAPY
jgi:4-hydroxybenzoyl-CoA reductase subunit beta